MKYKTSAALLQLLILLLLPSTKSWGQAADFESRTSQNSTLQVFSQLSPVIINRIHSWELVLTRPDGSPLAGAEISVLGGMPDHDHGLPTLPVVTTETSPGRYLLEGVRFHMPGRWQLSFTIQGPDGNESAQLDFEL